MSKAKRLELLEYALSKAISNLGYPVGCGIAPHPETLKRMAVICFKIATAEPSEHPANIAKGQP